MKKTLLTAFIFLLLKLLAAQLPSEVQMAWQYKINDTLAGPFVKSDNFYMLGDSSVIFLTKEYAQAPGVATKPTAVYFSKIDARGNLVIDRKKIEMYSPAFYLQNIDVTADGNLISLFLKDKAGLTEIKTDSAYLVKYDKELNTVGQGFISNQQTGGELWRAVGVTALTDGKIVVGYNKKEEPRGPRELTSTLALFTCFSSDGNILYTGTAVDPIVTIEKGSDAAFFITYRQLFENSQVLHSSADGRQLHIVYFLIPHSGLKPEVLTSNFALIPSTQQMIAVTRIDDSYSYDGPNAYVLYVTDSILTHSVAKKYDNVSFFKGAGLQLIKDREKGMYIMQSLNTAISPYLPHDYFGLCRLDSAGNAIWSVKFDDPNNEIGGVVGKMMPLAGNDFIVTVQTPAGPVLYRLSGNNQTLTARTSFTTEEAKKSLKLLSPQLSVGSTEDFSVKVASNPSTNYFSIITKSKSNSPLSIVITDNQGKIIEKLVVKSPNSSFKIGERYRPGFYILRAIQGNKSETIKLIKQ